MPFLQLLYVPVPHECPALHNRVVEPVPDHVDRALLVPVSLCLVPYKRLEMLGTRDGVCRAMYDVIGVVCVDESRILSPHLDLIALDLRWLDHRKIREPKDAFEDVRQSESTVEEEEMIFEARSILVLQNVTGHRAGFDKEWQWSDRSFGNVFADFD